MHCEMSDLEFIQYLKRELLKKPPEPIRSAMFASFGLNVANVNNPDASLRSKALRLIRFDQVATRMDRHETFRI